MDTTTPEKHLLEAALDALRAHGIEVDILADEAAYGPTRADAIVRIGYGPGTTVFAAEVKRHVTAATLGAVTEQMRQQPGKPPLLITDYITPPVADRLKANRLAFIDAAGNAFIDQPGNFIWVKGNRPKNKLPPAKPTVTRAFEPAGLKVLFAFLCDPALVNCPFREIADKAGVAHGTVGEVMGELTHAGFVYEPDRQGGGRKLKQVEQLLAEWAAAFARKLKPKLFIGRYRARDANWWKELAPANYGMALGAEPAAARITGYLRPAVITLYGERAEPRLIVDHALRTDPDGDVEIAKRFWRVETEETKKGLAPLPLVYADLLATGDPRCIETAGLVREQYLARLKP